jgi:hypothetical protein
MMKGMKRTTIYTTPTDRKMLATIIKALPGRVTRAQAIRVALEYYILILNSDGE